MNEKEMLMRRLSSEQFAAWELHMYMDTHPYDREMFMSMKKHRDEASKLKTEYEAKYGPLTHDAANDVSESWTQNPWPWEYRPELEDIPRAMGISDQGGNYNVPV